MDVLVYPGGRATRHHLGDVKVRQWLRGDTGARRRTVHRQRPRNHRHRGSAGIDMTLHLIARLHSPDRARAVRRYIQYDPQPPI